MVLLQTQTSKLLVRGLGICMLIHSSGNSCTCWRITEEGDVESRIYWELMCTGHWQQEVPPLKEFVVLLGTQTSDQKAWNDDKGRKEESVGNCWGAESLKASQERWPWSCLERCVHQVYQECCWPRSGETREQHVTFHRGCGVLGLGLSEIRSPTPTVKPASVRGEEHTKD